MCVPHTQTLGNALNASYGVLERSTANVYMGSSQNDCQPPSSNAYAMTQADVKQREEEEEQQIIKWVRPGGESSKTPPGQILPHHPMLQCD